MNEIKDSLKLTKVVKRISLFLMFLYFCAAMIFSYKTESYQISNAIYILFAGFIILHRIMRIGVAKSEFYLYLVVFLVYAITSYYWAIDKKIVVPKVNTYFNLSLLSLMILNIVEKPKDLTFAFKSFAIAGFLMCIYTFFFYGFDNLKLMMMEGDRIGHEINEENSFGLICSLSFAISICYAIFDDNKLFYLISVVLVLSVFMCGSRTALIGIILITALIIILNVSSKKIIGTVIFVATLVISFIIMSQSEYFSMIFERMELMGNVMNADNNMVTADSSTETRLEMVKVGWEWFLKNPIFGYGTDQYWALYRQKFGIARPAHNFHIQIMVDFGLVGFLIFETMFIKFITKARKIITLNTESKIVFITALSLIVIGFGNMYNSEKVFWIILGLCFSFVSIYDRRIRKISSKQRKGRLKHKRKPKKDLKADIME